MHLSSDAMRILMARFSPYKKYGGNYKEICQNIIKSCWNGRYFQTSAKGFTEFYVRDFAFCAESLCRLGFVKEVRLSLEYALHHFQKHGQIKTKVSRNGTPVDIFHIAPDSLALLIRTFIVTKNHDLAEKYRHFLNKEIRRYYDVIINKSTGLVKSGYFSSVRDHTIRHSSMYDNAMIAFLRENLSTLKLENPFKKYDYKQKIKKLFWTGSYFRDSLESQDVTGDANIFPFWLGIFKSSSMLKQSIRAIEENGLSDPYPLKYSAKKSQKNPISNKSLSFANFFAPNYQGDTIWMQNGMLYLKLLATVNRKKFLLYFNKYKTLIEHHGNFLELFTKEGQIYRTLFYKADEGLLWCSMFLDLDLERAAQAK